MAWLPTSTSGFVARLTSSAHRCTCVRPKTTSISPKKTLRSGAKNQLGQPQNQPYLGTKKPAQ